MTYNRGTLEIMAPSLEHELGKGVLGRFIETLAEETDLPIYLLDSTTFQRTELSGAAFLLLPALLLTIPQRSLTITLCRKSKRDPIKDNDLKLTLAQNCSSYN